MQTSSIHQNAKSQGVMQACTLNSYSNNSDKILIKCKHLVYTGMQTSGIHRSSVHCTEKQHKSI